MLIICKAGTQDRGVLLFYHILKAFFPSHVN